RVERLEVVGEGGIVGALGDLAVQGHHGVNGNRVVGDHRQRGTGLGRVAQLSEVGDRGAHDGRLRPDIRREGTAYAGDQRLDLGGRRVGRVVPVLEGTGIADAPACLVAFVLGGLPQVGVLLAAAGRVGQ